MTGENRAAEDAGHAAALAHMEAPFGRDVLAPICDFHDLAWARQVNVQRIHSLGGF